MSSTEETLCPYYSRRVAACSGLFDLEELVRHYKDIHGKHPAEISQLLRYHQRRGKINVASEFLDAAVSRRALLAFARGIGFIVPAALKEITDGN